MTRLTNLIKEALRTPLHELEERFKVIDTKTGEVIDNDLPKKIAQKLAAKKTEWASYPDKKESTIAKIAKTLDESKKKDCNCGCNTCENVGNEGVLLNESVAPKQILSENLQYHVHNKLPLTENTFRYGSQSFINLWAEARALYLREIIHVNNDDKEILTETDLGNYGMYEGKKVPLDMPLDEESVNESFKKGDKVKFVGEKSIFKNLDPNKTYIIGDVIRDTLFDDVRYVIDYNQELTPLEANDIQLAEKEGVPHYTKDNKEWKGKVHKMPDGSLMSGNPHDEDGSGPNGKSEKLYHKGELDEVQDFDEEGDWEDDDNIYTGPYSYGIDKRTWDNDWRLPQDNLFNTSKTIDATNNRMDSIRKMLKKYPKELAKFENDPEYPAFDMTYDELVKWYKSISNFDLSESVKKKKKKDPPLNKPKRGGSKAYYVYVKDPRTKKVKKVSFGSGGLKAKINNKEARKAFAARHKCSTKKDKTKAGYWSCNLPRYAKLLGIKSSFSGFW